MERETSTKNIQEQIMRTGKKTGSCAMCQLLCSLLFKAVEMSPLLTASLCLITREGCDTVSVEV